MLEQNVLPVIEMIFSWDTIIIASLENSHLGLILGDLQNSGETHYTQYARIMYKYDTKVPRYLLCHL